MLAQDALAEVLEVQADGKQLSAGTAFAVSRDFAFTAFHVVGNRETGAFRTSPIILRFRRLREDYRIELYEQPASRRDGDPQLDAAVLQLEIPLPDDLRPIALSREAEAGESFWSDGHPLLEGPDIVRIHGTVVAVQTWIFGGLPAIQLHSEEAGEGMPLQGMSGAPVFVGRGTKRAAIGLIRWNPTRAEDVEDLAVGGTVYACPASAIVKRWPEFLLGMISRSTLADVLYFPFPKVSEADCYEQLGVSKSEYVDKYRNRGEKPPYVPRDIDNELTEALKHRDFVLLVGPAKAGKTRTAYEALHKVAPSIPMIVPYKSQSLENIIEELLALTDFPSQSVLWLDDLEKFLSQGTLTLRLVNSLRELRIQTVATMRSSELGRWKQLNNEIGREAQEILGRAELIKLEDSITQQEDKWARAMYPDLKLERGLGESFIAGRELRQRYDFGSSPVVAVVRAANDWRRTGSTAPIGRDDLFVLFKRHFEDLEPTQDATEEVFNTAEKDARTPVTHYIALLTKERLADGEVGYSVEEYISDYLEKQGRPIVEEAWRLALPRLESEYDCLAVGISAYDRGRWDIAEKAWVTATTYSSYMCAINLGLLLKQQDRAQEAEKAFREAIRLNPQDAVGYYDLGNVLSEQHRPEEAEITYREAIRLNPQDALAHYNLGLLLWKQRRPEEAEITFRETIRFNPQFAPAYYNLGNLLSEQRRPEEAEKAYREAIQLNPQYAVAYYNLGLVLKQQGRAQEAEKAFREAIGLDPQNADVHYSLGVLLLSGRRRREQAETAFREAIRLNPQHADAHDNLGNLLSEQYRPEEAEKSYREAIRLNPHVAHAHSNLGFLLWKQRRPEEAETAYREAIRLNPQFAPAHSNLGFLLKQQGRPQEAETAYREAIRFNPQFAGAQCNLGVLLLEQRRPEEAETAFREAIQLDPQFAVAYNNLGNLLSEQHRPEEAEKAYREAIRLDPQYAVAYNNLGNLLSEQHRPEEAEKAYREAIRLNPQFAE